MARITVEDCIDKFPSRFELVLIASNRARKLFSGENPTVEIDNDKNTVIALREIADETITKEQLKNDLIEEYQTNNFSEDEDIEELEDNTSDNKDEVNDIDNNETVLEELYTKDVKQDDTNDDQQTKETNTEPSQDNFEKSSDEEIIQDSQTD